uniref:Uncharacterized protein n=1 Tax=Lepeophtheirus salmonis TaxID=72036 RepID=A0A0K2UIX1_LEPSM
MHKNFISEVPELRARHQRYVRHGVVLMISCSAQTTFV